MLLTVFFDKAAENTQAALARMVCEGSLFVDHILHLRELFGRIRIGFDFFRLTSDDFGFSSGTSGELDFWG